MGLVAVYVLAYFLLLEINLEELSIPFDEINIWNEVVYTCCLETIVTVSKQTNNDECDL